MKAKTCPLCNERPATSLVGNLCRICHGKKRYIELPPEEQERRMLTVVPKRYLEAVMTDLPEKLQDGKIVDTDTGILLWGVPGIGKTYTMAAYARHFIEEGFSVQRIHYEELCLKLRDTFNNPLKSEWGLLEPLVNCDKLFIEDVGVTRSISNTETDFSVRVFQVLLDLRMEQLRPTFITSNKSVENLAKSFDERIGDRLRTFYVYNLGKQSKRKSK